MEERLECQQSNQVRYKTNPEFGLSVEVSLEHATNKGIWYFLTFLVNLKFMLFEFFIQLKCRSAMPLTKFYINSPISLIVKSFNFFIFVQTKWKSTSSWRRPARRTGAFRREKWCDRRFRSKRVSARGWAKKPSSSWALLLM